MTVLGDIAFKGKMRPYRWVFKKIEGHRQIQGRHREKTGKDKTLGGKKNNSVDIVILNFFAPKIKENSFILLMLPSIWHFTMAV